MPEQAHYDQVAEEIRQQRVVDGLWTRAFAEAAGDTDRARAIYIQLRVAQLAGTNSTATPPPVAAQAGSQVRPWVRYWARLIDICLFSFCLGGVLTIIAPGVASDSEQLFGLLFLFLWCFFEPIFLSVWGATPGKALLRVSVRNPDGSLLRYSAALGRSFDVWLRGLGIGIPLLNLFTTLFGYNTLEKHGITSWDKSSNTRVTHEVIGPVRVMVAILLFFVFAFFIYLGYKQA